MKSATVVLSVLASVFVLGACQTALAFEYEVEMDNFVFTPHGTHINVGDMITWRNRDAVPHSATSDNGVWDSGMLNQNQTFSFTFTSGGVFPYHCDLHPSMKDTIFVGPQTGVGEQPIPLEFQLSQNYPNPFNAQTMIKYSLPQPAHVNIEIFNVLGQKIVNLVNDRQEAGEHQIAWNAAEQSSGVFFYRVNVDGAAKMGRMELLK